MLPIWSPLSLWWSLCAVGAVFLTAVSLLGKHWAPCAYLCLLVFLYFVFLVFFTFCSLLSSPVEHWTCRYYSVRCRCSARANKTCPIKIFKAPPIIIFMLELAPSSPPKQGIRIPSQGSANGVSLENWLGLVGRALRPKHRHSQFYFGDCHTDSRDLKEWWEQQRFG